MPIQKPPTAPIIFSKGRSELLWMNDLSEKNMNNSRPQIIIIALQILSNSSYAFLVIWLLEISMLPNGRGKGVVLLTIL